MTVWPTAGSVSRAVLAGASEASGATGLRTSTVVPSSGAAHGASGPGKTSGPSSMIVSSFSSAGRRPSQRIRDSARLSARSMSPVVVLNLYSANQRKSVVEPGTK
jgi:hypothetical protein